MYCIPLNPSTFSYLILTCNAACEICHDFLTLRSHGNLLLKGLALSMKCIVSKSAAFDSLGKIIKDNRVIQTHISCNTLLCAKGFDTQGLRW